MNTFKKLLLGAVASTAILLGAARHEGLSVPPEVDYLAIYHIDVGQGDATLIISPAGKTLLMDAGGQKQGREKVGAVLRALGITTIDFMVTSHFHADHLGGADQVRNILTSVPVGVLDRGTIGPMDTPEKKKIRLTQYGQYVEAMELPDAREPVLLGNGAIDLGEGVSVLVVAANGCVFGKRDESQNKKGDENATSVALVINYGDFDYFVGGDLPGGGLSGNKVTEDLETLVADVVGDVDILRFSHHGSQTSSNKGFLATLAPEIGVISVGNGHPNTGYKHPSRAMLDRVHDLKKTPGFPLKTIFMTNRGHTNGGLSDKDLEILTIIGGDVIVFAAENYYIVNGKIFATDGKKSGAATVAPGDTKLCKAP